MRPISHKLGALLVKLLSLSLSLSLSSFAHATPPFKIEFSLCDALLGEKHIECLTTPSHNQVLSYDDDFKTWRPRSLNGVSYKGAWKALPALPPMTNLVPGDYFVISAAQGVFDVGDWIILNESLGFQRIEKSLFVNRVFGQVGNVQAEKNDYKLDMLGDVDLTAAPSSNEVLYYDGTNWVAESISNAPTGVAGGDLSGTYPNPLIKNNSITDSHIANSALSQSKINGLSAALSGKQSTITATSTGDYFRGDKTFTTLNTSIVTEGLNLYFTNARTLGILLGGFDNTLTGQVTSADSMLRAFGKVQNQINSLSTGGSNYLSKNSPDTLSGGVLVTGSITTSGSGDIILGVTPTLPNSAISKSYADGKLTKSTGGVVSGVVNLDNNFKIKGGTNYVTLRGQATSTNYNLVLPENSGTAGYVLSTDGNGNTSWVTPNGKIPSGAAGGELTGIYPNPSLGSNIITDSQIANAAISQAKINGLITAINGLESSVTATSVSDYFNGAKAFVNFGNSVRDSALTGLSTATDSTVTATDSVLVSLGNLQSQNSSRLAKGSSDTLSGAITLTGSIVTSGTGDIRVGNTPPSNSSIVNKTYMDGKLDKTTGGTMSGAVNFNSDLKLKGGANYTNLKANGATDSYDFSLPPNGGASGYVLSTDGSGNTSWESEGGAWDVSAPNVSRNTGNVGIGTASPATNTRLQINGQISASSKSITTAAVNFVDGNSVTTTFDCASDLLLSNIRDGGNYIVIVTGTGSNQCNFNTSVTGDDPATVSYRFLPANSTRANNTHTVYSLSRIGNTVYASWITGY